MRSKKNEFAGLLLFLSGIAALIYQTLWIKQLGLVVGVDVHAITIGVSAFFTGLAAGGLYFGKKADQKLRPIKLFAQLEAIIGVGGFISTVFFFSAPQAFVAISNDLGPLAWLLPFLMVGIPAFFMGGTLPVMMRCIHPDQENISKTSGGYYAINTFGAILGTLLVPFFLIPSFGLIGTSLAAASLNLLIAGSAMILPVFKTDSKMASVTKNTLNKGASTALTLYALAGGIAIGYEVVWSQAIAPLLSSRVYAFASMLSIYLLGLVVGSFIYGRFADRNAYPWRTFGTFIAGAGLSAVLIFVLLGPWIIEFQDSIGKSVFALTNNNQVANLARFSATAVVTIFIPTVCLGAAFPAAVRIIAREDQIGNDIGRITAFNTAGGIIGTFITGFILIPVIGTMKTLGFLGLLATLIAIYPLLKESNNQKKRWLMVGFPVAIMIVLFFLLPSNQIADLLSERRGGQTIFYSEKAGGSVAVVEQNTPSGDFRRLYIQGVSNSGNSMPSLRYMRLQALLPLLIHNGDPKSAMVIGFGTGITFGTMLTYPSLEQRVCAELLPGVLEAASYFDENLQVNDNPDVEIRLHDGRHELLRSEQKYDVITLEPPPPTAAGVVNLYSSEFYQLAKMRLNKQGLLAQWWPLASQNEEASKALVRSFLDVFPHVTLWTTELHETLLIGSNEVINLDLGIVEERFNSGTVKENLREVGIMSGEDLLSTYISGKEELVAYVGNIKAVTDNFPSIEYANWTRKGEFPRVLVEVSKLASEIPVVTNDPAALERIEIKRQKLWTLYRAGYFMYLRDEENWQAMLKRIVPEIKANPYYRSFVPER